MIITDVVVMVVDVIRVVIIVCVFAFEFVHTHRLTFLSKNSINIVFDVVDVQVDRRQTRF